MKINFCGKEYDINTIEVRCHDKNVTTLTPLKALKKLEVLCLEFINIEDLTLLEGMEELKGLYLSGTQVKDLTPLKGLKKLERLDLFGTQVTESQVDELRKALPKCYITGP